MKVNYSRLIQALVLITVISSCAIKPPTTSDYDTAYNFSKLRNYAWIQPTDSEKVATLDNRRQVNAIETVLNQKGFNKVNDAEKADFLLKTHMVTDKKVDVDRFYSTWGYHPFFHPNVAYPSFHGWPSNSTTVVTERKVGTLVLDIVDPEKKQVIWRGTVESPLGIYSNRTPEERATIELKNANAMLETFPPGKVIAK